MDDLPTGVLYLLLHTFLRIGIHEGQADIRLRHDDGELRLSLHSLAPQVLVQDGHRLAHVVATGGQRPHIAGVGKCRLADEMSDDMRRLPAVSGKAEAQPLVVLQHVVQHSFLQLVGNGQQFLP